MSSRSRGKKCYSEACSNFGTTRAFVSLGFDSLAFASVAFDSLAFASVAFASLAFASLAFASVAFDSFASAYLAGPGLVCGFFARRCNSNQLLLHLVVVFDCEEELRA